MRRAVLARAAAGLVGLLVWGMAAAGHASVDAGDRAWAARAETLDGERADPARVERRDLDPLKAFSRPEVTEGRFSTITLSTCGGCKGLMLASVKNVEVEVEDDGDTKQNETEVLTHVVLDSPTYDALAKL